MQTIIRGTHSDLLAVDRSNYIVNIPNQVLRKPAPLDEQNQLNDNSVCVVCHYSFNEGSIEWSDKIKAICHPFKKTKFFPEGKKLYLLSESDFTDELWFPANEPSGGTEYDYVYFTFDSRHGMKTKGLYMLPPLIETAWGQALKGLVIDYADVKKRSHQDAQLGSTGEHLTITRKRINKLEKNERTGITIKRGDFSQNDVAKFIRQSKFVVFLSTADASPRLMTEALVCGRPVIVNRHLYGGWKYLNEDNSMSFGGSVGYQNMENNKDRIYRRMRRLWQSAKTTEFNSSIIKQEYYAKYGLFNAASHLARVINDVEGSEKYRFVFYPEFKEVFEENRDKWIDFK